MSMVISKKSKNFEKISECPQNIIMKGFRCERKQLKSVGIDNLHVKVLGKSGKTKIMLKIEYVYQYDEKLYEKLTTLYNSKNYEGLAKAWKEAKSIKT